MHFEEAFDQLKWDAFLARQQYRPFLQSWAMGEVYADIGQPPLKLIAEEGGKVHAICFAHVVPAKRGKHLSVPYGPILDDSLHANARLQILVSLTNELKHQARTHGCAFVRMSPFFPANMIEGQQLNVPDAIESPLHLLAEHVWYLPLTTQDPWCSPTPNPSPDGGGATRPNIPVRYGREGWGPRSEEDLLMHMRKTTRNLIRRAERDGVTIEASLDPVHDLPLFLKLHDETRRRHSFTPYTTAFFESQVKHFSKRNELTLYLARFQGEVIATSIHMHAFGETGYHHGASSSAHSKIPASYLLQWRAIQDALKRGDHVYNFWGIAPPAGGNSNNQIPNSKHPFAGVSLFKTGFGGSLLNLVHCIDIPVAKKYWLTYGFETVRKWRRGF